MRATDKFLDEMMDVAEKAVWDPEVLYNLLKGLERFRLLPLRDAIVKTAAYLDNLYQTGELLWDEYEDLRLQLEEYMPDVLE